MERLTVKRDEGHYTASIDTIQVEGNQCSGRLVERLAAYENSREMIEQQYNQATDKLASFKSQGRLKSSQAQQLLAQKLTYASMLRLLE